MARKLIFREDMIPIDRKCIEQGLSRAELSRRSGVPLRTIESWSRHINLPRDVYQLYKISRVLGCSIEDIIEPERAKARASRRTVSSEESEK